MAQGIIYMVEGGGLRRMQPSVPENENRMQELVARYPELITDGDGDLLLIRREQPITDGEAASRWSLDHLFVTRDGVPVFVELKRASDNRLRREVVGQMLDYAANAATYWQAGTVAQSFATSAIRLNLDPDAVLADFTGGRGPDEFWLQVDSNLKAGRIKLVFVADTIPRELAVIIEFLNDQMRADVRGVELRWFSDGAGVTTLSPRIIGETERSQAGKEARSRPDPLSVEEWLDRHFAGKGPSAGAGARAFVELIAATGGEPVIPNTQGSIKANYRAANGKAVDPMYLMSGGGLVLALGYLANTPAYASDDSRRSLLARYAELVGPLRSDNAAGYPSFKVARMSEPDVANGIRAILVEIVQALKAPGR